MKFLLSCYNLPVVIFLCLMLTACNNVPASQPQPVTGNKAGTAPLKNKETDRTKKKSKRELRYLYFANGGIVGYFDDGTVTGCPRCDFCRSNIIAMFDEKPYGTYTVQPDGSLLIDGHNKEFPEYDETMPDGWALIDYKWYIKPPQE